MKTLLAALCLIIISGCSKANKDELKDRQSEVWEKQGFKVIAYEGYQYGLGAFNYGGAKVWSRLEKIPDNGITYSGYIVKWGDEVHVYGPTAIDAIRP